MQQKTGLFEDIVGAMGALGTEGRVWVPYSHVTREDARHLVHAIKSNALSVTAVYHCGAWYLDVRRAEIEAGSSAA